MGMKGVIAASALVLAGCVTARAGERLTLPGVAARCQALQQEPGFYALDEVQRLWLEDCAQAFSAGPELQAAKARVRLALDYRAERSLQARFGPGAFEELAAGLRQDVRALEAAVGAQDAEAGALLARWRHEVLHDTSGALELACQSAQAAPALYEGQLRCGDYLQAARRDVSAAVKRWVAAYPLAGTRAQQCRVVERITAVSLTPERDQADMSPTVVTFCQQRAQERQREAQAARLRDAARELQDAADTALKAKPPPPPAEAPAKP